MLLPPGSSGRKGSVLNSDSSLGLDRLGLALGRMT